MKVCHVCKCECEDYAELCPVCGAYLLSNTEEESKTEKIIEKPVLLASLDDMVSAEILRDILNENGIPNSSSETGENGAMKVTFGGGFIAEEIYVDSCDFEKADELYREFLESENEFVFDDEEFDEEI